RNFHSGYMLCILAARMLAHLRDGWRELKQGRPGHRFQDRYQRGREGAACGTVKKWSLIVGGVFLIVAGIVLLPLPGPGMLVIALGALMMAEESRASAKALDWIEAKTRKLLGR
ncbi:MAG TPA: PGPGW domain-containing protein, partial [Burkholderiales bacterium]|nr:PGPGW domain-containing protein [Burkholderiales bacterium]